MRCYAYFGWWVYYVLSILAFQKYFLKSISVVNHDKQTGFNLSKKIAITLKCLIVKVLRCWMSLSEEVGMAISVNGLCKTPPLKRLKDLKTENQRHFSQREDADQLFSQLVAAEQRGNFWSLSLIQRKSLHVAGLTWDIWEHSGPIDFKNYRTTSVRAPSSISTPSRIVRTPSTRIHTPSNFCMLLGR